jgi:hypothetical protein
MNLFRTITLEMPPKAIIRITRQQALQLTPNYETFDPTRPEQLNIPAFPAIKTRDIIIFHTRSSSVCMVPNFKERICAAFLVLARRRFPDLFGDDKVEIPDHTSIPEILLAMAHKDKLFHHNHTVGPAYNAFLVHGQSTGFRTVLGQLLSLGLVNLSLITLNFETLLRLEGVPDLNTRLYAAMTLLFTNALAIIEDDRKTSLLTWLKADLPTLGCVWKNMKDTQVQPKTN